jgi:hypothetical protein
MPRMRPLTALIYLLLCAAGQQLLAQGYVLPPEQLMVQGHVTDGDHVLAGSEVVLYKDNVVVDRVTTGKRGRFRFQLDLQARYVVEFTHAGSVTKRIALDTQVPPSATSYGHELEKIVLNITLIDRSRYQGAAMDELDLPSALIQYDRKSQSFVSDIEYTQAMLLTNGSILLAAAKANASPTPLEP